MTFKGIIGSVNCVHDWCKVVNHLKKKKAIACFVCLMDVTDKKNVFSVQIEKLLCKQSCVCLFICFMDAFHQLGM